MNREIKFRMWIKERKMMVYVDDFYRDGICESLCPFGSLECDEWYPMCDAKLLKFLYSLSVDKRYVLMQYTGLKDKNGKEIYEGDIVRHVKSPSVTFYYVVEWDDKLAGFRLKWKTGGGIYYLDFYVEVLPDKLEVVGNMFENPELLRVEE